MDTEEQEPQEPQTPAQVISKIQQEERKSAAFVDEMRGLTKTPFFTSPRNGNPPPSQPGR